MKKFWIFTSMIIFSWIGWWLGGKVGIVTAYFVSCAGSVLGVYIGWHINRHFFE